MWRITAILAMAFLAVGLTGCHHGYGIFRADDVRHSARVDITKYDRGVLYVKAICETGMGNAAIELKKHDHRCPAWPAKIVVQLQHCNCGKHQFNSLEQFHATVERCPGQVHELRTKHLVNPQNWIQVEIYLEPADRTVRVINMDWIATYRI